MSQSKALSVRALHLAGLPAPVHEVVTSLDAARSVAERLGWPVVVKPVDLDRGEGVSVDVDAARLEPAFEEALRLSPAKHVIVERQVEGVCHRLFMAHGRLLYAVKRLPMSVEGDGVTDIAGLVEAELARQRADAMDLKAASLQDVLGQETNRLLRVYGARSLQANTSRMGG